MSVKETQVNILIGALLLNGFFGVVGFFVVEDYFPYLGGILFGVIIALLNFRLLFLTLDRAVKMPPAKAQAYATSRYFIRYVITGVVVYVSIRAQHINVLGTILGLISLKLVIFKTQLFNSKAYFKNIFKRKEEK
ncbi:ATP synthase subunit I [Alkaliphilus serpentinus]|uniref:ATP synthase subunit I n=2 Tax=Alkaliphilus serpentinus TaxID=1482731 RepID=A0A833MEE0_9FIRM|nr:ATP synthase subunit I [Alkaliphilus serpentinus]